MADQLRVRRIMWRRAVDRSFRSGWRFGAGRRKTDQPAGTGEITEKQWWATHENQCGIEVFVIPLDVVHIMLDCLPPAHGVEVNAGIISLDGLKERLEGIL